MGYEDTEIGKGHPLAYLIIVHYKPYSVKGQNNSEKVMHQISATVSELAVEMIPATLLYYVLLPIN